LERAGVSRLYYVWLALFEVIEDEEDEGEESEVYNRCVSSSFSAQFNSIHTHFSQPHTIPTKLQTLATSTFTMSALAANLSLPDREAIPDALYRSIFGLDAEDKTIFESAWHKDATFIYDGAPPTQGLDAILETTFKYIGAGLDTTHSVSNVRIDAKDGANTAKVTAHALAQHYRKGDGKNPKASRYLTGNMYWIDLAKDESDGLWKIKTLEIKVIWREGDAGVVGQ
jgi:hypothetical protein